MALLYSLLAIVMLASSKEQLGVHRVEFVASVAAYLAAGILGGAAVGALLPFTKSLPGALFVSVIAGNIIFFCMGIAMEGPFWKWGLGEWKQVWVVGSLFGAIAGGAAWRGRKSL